MKRERCSARTQKAVCNGFRRNGSPVASLFNWLLLLYPFITSQEWLGKVTNSVAKCIVVRFIETRILKSSIEGNLFWCVQLVFWQMHFKHCRVNLECLRGRPIAYCFVCGKNPEINVEANEDVEAEVVVAGAGIKPMKMWKLKWLWLAQV